MKKSFAITFLSLCITGCSTVTPPVIQDDAPAYDMSTPHQYTPISSGFLFFTYDEKGEVDGGIFTLNSKLKYNQLIKDYRLQFKQDTTIDIKENDGLEPYYDQFGNYLYRLDAEHIHYFMKLNRWKKENRPDDTIWMKIKDKVTG